MQTQLYHCHYFVLQNFFFIFKDLNLNMQNLHSEVFELAKHKFHFLLSTIKISFNPCIFVATDM